MRRSTASKILHMVLAIGFSLCVGALAFWWSLGNTISFTESVMQVGVWGWVMGLVIQFGPQVFLALAATATKTQRTYWIIAFFVFSGVDALTNIGATITLLNSGATMTALELGVRIFTDIVIVFGEEMVGYGVAVIFHDMAEIITELGEEPPGWMFIAEDMASQVATGRQAGQPARQQGPLASNQSRPQRSGQPPIPADLFGPPMRE